MIGLDDESVRKLLARVVLLKARVAAKKVRLRNKQIHAAMEAGMRQALTSHGIAFDEQRGDLRDPNVIAALFKQLSEKGTKKAATKGSVAGKKSSSSAAKKKPKTAKPKPKPKSNRSMLQQTPAANNSAVINGHSVCAPHSTFPFAASSAKASLGMFSPGPLGRVAAPVPTSAAAPPVDQGLMAMIDNCIGFYG